MAPAQEKKPKEIDNVMRPTNSPGPEEQDPDEHKIDRTAPAGSENSLGAESVRDGRPATDDSTVEAMDEIGPGTSTP